MPDTYVLSCEAETGALARRVAPQLRPGDTLLLDGPIGAGKTVFARAVIQEKLAAEGRREDVPSPTFTLVQVYDVGETEIWHVDLYRLTGPDEVLELGLIEAFETAICLVEWPDRLGEVRPQSAITLTFSVGTNDAERQLRVAGGGTRWQELIAEVPIEH